MSHRVRRGGHEPRPGVKRDHLRRRRRHILRRLGAHGAGDTATFTVGPNQQVGVSGVPTLLLGDGGVAVYSAAVSTIATQRVFVYVVGSQQITSDLKVVGLTLNGGSVSAPGSQFLGPATPVAARLNFTTGSQPESVAVGDVNGASPRSPSRTSW